MKISQDAVDRMACLSLRNVEIACLAISKRVSQLQDRFAEDPGLSQDEAYVVVHTEYIEALLQLVSVLEAEPAPPRVLQPIRDAQAEVLARAKSLQIPRR